MIVEINAGPDSCTADFRLDVDLAQWHENMVVSAGLSAVDKAFVIDIAKCGKRRIAKITLLLGHWLLNNYWGGLNLNFDGGLGLCLLRFFNDRRGRRRRRRRLWLTFHLGWASYWLYSCRIAFRVFSCSATGTSHMYITSLY